MYVSAIVVAAGRGKRLKLRLSKPVVKIGSWPIIVYALKTLGNHPEIKEIIVVANLKNRKQIAGIIKQYRIRKAKKIVLGGLRRCDSVFCGLKAVSPRADLVLIHDGVRPFVEKKTVSEVISAAKKSGAAIAGVPVVATIKAVVRRACRSVVRKTLNRENLWEIQTPQVFQKNLLLKAYRKFAGAPVTDDAMLVEKLRRRVAVVMGSYYNIKITTPEDLVIAEAILKAQSIKRKA